MSAFFTTHCIQDIVVILLQVVVYNPPQRTGGSGAPLQCKPYTSPGNVIASGCSQSATGPVWRDQGCPSLLVVTNVAMRSITTSRSADYDSELFNENSFI